MMVVVAATVLNALWQDALLVVCVWLLLRAWPHINAATRYVVWGATLVAAFVVPAATTVAFFTPARPLTERPAVTAPVQHAAAPALSQAHPVGVAPPARTEVARPSAAPALTASLPARLRVTLPWGVALGVFVAWALLAGYALVGLIVGLWRLEQLKRDALPLPVDYRDAMPQWNDANKGRRPVRLCVSEAIDVPVAVGLFDAMILIPRGLLERLTPAEVEQISLHELAHLRRGDDWSNCLQRLIVAALGWNPAAIFVAQQLELEREVACDDWVLSSVGAVRPYALCLTKMAETAAWPHHPMPAPGVFTTRKQISLRIERLLGAGRDIATSLAIGPTAAAVAAVGAIALVIALVAPSIAAPSIALREIASQPSAPVSHAPATASAAKPTIVKVSEVVRVPVRVPVRVTVPVPVRVAAAPAAAPPNRANPPAPRANDSYGAFSEKVATDVDSAVNKMIGQQLATVANPARVVAQSDGKSCVGCDLHGVNWPGRDLHGANYTGVDFRGANLAGANLSDSKLNGVDFKDADLSGASLRRAHLTGCDFSQTNLSGVDFSGARLSGCKFTGARLQGAQLRDVLDGCKACDFSRASLTGLDLHGVRVNGADFAHADLRNVNFAGAELVGSDFSRAQMDGANLAGATLNGCDLAGVDLSRVDLSKTKLIGTDLSNRSTPP